MRLGNFLASTGDEHGAGLGEQFVHGVLAGAGDGLIGRHHDALDRRLVVQRLEGHDELGGRAVRVGDDVLLGEALHRVGVHFRHDQRNVAVVAEGRGVIDHDAALGADLRRPLLRHLAAGRHQADVGVGEIIVLEGFDLERLVAERDFRPDRTAGGKRNDLIRGKAPLGEDVEHFAAHIARGTDDGDLVAHVVSPEGPAIHRLGRARAFTR